MSEPHKVVCPGRETRTWLDLYRELEGVKRDLERLKYDSDLQREVAYGKVVRLNKRIQELEKK